LTEKPWGAKAATEERLNAETTAVLNFMVNRFVEMI